MKITSLRVLPLLASALLGASVARQAMAADAPPPPPGISRTTLQDKDLSVVGRHSLTVLIGVAPGAEIPRHTHPGEEIGYVIEGAFVLEIDGMASQVLKAGDAFLVPSGATHGGRNGGPTPLKVVSTYFLEIGQSPSTPAAGEPAPLPPGMTRTTLQDEGLSESGRHALTVLIGIAPGAAIPRHTHPGEEIGYVVEGAFTLEIDGMPPQTLKAGEAFFVPSGVIHGGRNSGLTPLKLVSTYCLAVGQPPSSPATTK